MVSAALKRLRTRAQNGNVDAMCDLAARFERGEGVSENHSQAAAWYRRAADKGHAGAMVKLAMCYENGRGVSKSYPEAVAWYERSADTGDAQAQHALGICYELGRGVPQDYAAAVELYRRAADNGLAGAMFSLGLCFDKGYGVTQDHGQAVEWYGAAANGGHAGAMNSLGLAYYNGQGVPQDYAKAVECFRRAAEKGHVSARFSLGECYETGRGVALDTAEARRFYENAAAKGYQSAVTALRRLGLAQQPQAATMAGGTSASRLGSTAEQAAAQATPQVATTAAPTSSPWDRRRDAHLELEQQLNVELERRVSERLQACCTTCGRDIERGGSVLLLACMHSSCTVCLHEKARPTATLMCTLCNIPSTIHRAKAVRHPYVEAALAPPSHNCEECVGSKEATSRCTTCPLYLCDVHSAAHRMALKTHAHALEPVSTVDSGNICVKHEKPLDVYCASCQAAICYQCTLHDAAHPAVSHVTESLQAYHERARGRINDASRRAETVAVAVRADRALRASITSADIDERSNTLKEIITSKVDALYALLRERHAELLNEVDAIAAEEKQRVNDLGEAERVAYTVLMTTTPLAWQLAKAQTPAPTVARLEPALCSRLDALVNAAPAEPMPQAARVTFTLAETELEAAIRGAGQLTIEPN